jgi:hypothetical protein
MIEKAQNIFRKESLKLLLICGLLLVFAACSAGKESSSFSKAKEVPVKLSATVDKAVASPGDIITLTIKAVHRSDILLELPEIADKLSDFRIVNSSFSQPVRDDDYMIVERLYKLQADISGSYIIEPIRVAYSLPGGEEITTKTPKIFIEIESMLAKEGEVKDIRDIKPPLALPFPYRMIFLILAVIGGVILAILVIHKLIDRRRSRKRAQEVRLRPAHEEALEALDMLLNKRLVEKGRMKKFCFEISLIFRRYLQARFGFPAIDLTAEEIIPRVEDDGIIEEDLRQLVREFLADTDMVKFAKYQPTPNEMEKVLRHTRTFIDRTKLEPTILSGSAGDGEKP